MKDVSIPQRFRAMMNDHRIFYHQAVCDMANHCVISFDGQIDENRMTKAVRLTLDAEPILGCRLVKGWWRMHWERRTDLDTCELFRMIESEDVRQEVTRFLSIPSDPCKDPQVQALLIRSDTDTLCIRVLHVVADGAGLKEYAYLLASVYRQLAKYPGYKPHPNLNGSRSMRQVSRQFGIMDRLRIIRRMYRELKLNLSPRRSCALLLDKADRSDRTNVISRIDPDLFRTIKAYSRRHGTSMNDVMLTAVSRGLLNEINPPLELPVNLGVAVDFRRFLDTGKSRAICNLIGLVSLKTDQNPGAPFDDTLLRVRAQMNVLKEDCLGLGTYSYFVILHTILPCSWNQWLFRKMVDAASNNPHQISNGYSNVGIIDTEQLNFGDIKISDAYITMPVMRSPFFAIAISRFGESMTLSTSFTGVSVNKPIVEQLLRRIKKELETLA